MQNQRFLIQILALFSLLSVAFAGIEPLKISFNTTLLCTESYLLTINYQNTVAGNTVIFAGGLGTFTRYVTATTTGTSGSVSTYIVYTAGYDYYAQLKDTSGAVLVEIDLANYASPCTGLTTNSLPASKQAVWVADVYRKDTATSSYPYFWNSHLQSAADEVASMTTTACESAANWSNGGLQLLESNGYNDTSIASCFLVTGSTADAGGLIQGIASLGTSNILQQNWGTYDEIAVSQSTSNKRWVVILATRPRNKRCGNKFRPVVLNFEECDDGNLNNGDGCDFECKVESSNGWSCSESILTEGSTCVQGPVPPTAFVPVAAPTIAPQIESPVASTPTSSAPSATPTSGTPVGSTPTAATPSGSSPSAVPQGSAPTGQTPTGQTPTGQTPTSQTPTGQTPTGQTPTGQTPTAGQTPSSSSPQGSTPSSSSPNATPSSESPMASTPSDASPLPSQSPDGSFTPSGTPVNVPTISPSSPRPSRTPGDSGVVSGSEKITASVVMVIVTMLSVIFTI